MAGKLRRIVLKATLDELYACNGGRKRAAQALGISVRAVRNYINEMRRGGYGPVPPPLLPPNAGGRKYTHEVPCPCTDQKCQTRAALHYKMALKKTKAIQIKQGYCEKCGRCRPIAGKCARCFGDATA